MMQMKFQPLETETTEKEERGKEGSKEKKEGRSEEWQI